MCTKPRLTALGKRSVGAEPLALGRYMRYCDIFCGTDHGNKERKNAMKPWEEASSRVSSGITLHPPSEGRSGTVLRPSVSFAQGTP